MTWFPTFLNPWYAAAAAAVAVPALLILYFLKLRRREVEVASTLLWKKAIQDLQVNAPFQKLRRNLLLILQMLLLAALLLSLSRPVTFYTPGAGKNSVILIDQSASMSAADVDGKTRLEEAKRRAKDLVDSMQRGSTAMVIAFDDKGHPLQPFTGDTLALKRAIDSIQPTDRKSRLKEAYQLAEAQTAFDPNQLRSITTPPDIWVYSDGRVLDAAELRVQGTLKYEKIGSDKTGNIGIVALSAKRNYERPTEVQIFARLANYGIDPVNADVQLSVGQIDQNNARTEDLRVRGVASVTLLPERWDETQRAKAQSEGQTAKDSVEFTLDLTSAAVIRIDQKSAAGDSLAADDSAQVIIPPPKALAVALVTDGNYFMEKLIGNLNLKDPAILTPTQFEQMPAADVSKYDVVIFDRGYKPKQLPKSGNFVYFGAIPDGIKVKQAKDNGKPILVDESGVLDWNRDHPILRGLSLAKVYVAEAIKLDLPPESEVLIEGMKCPLLVLHREGRSTHLIFPFDSLQSYNFLTKPVFPLMMYQALQYLALGSDLGVSQSFEPGATPRIPRTNLSQIAGEPPKSIRLIGPTGSRTVIVPEAGDFALPALDRVGLYSTNPVVPGYERLAVNLLDGNESNLLPLNSPPGGFGEMVSGAGKKSRLDLWWWIVACAGLPLLMVEWWVYTRRVHL